MFLSYQSENALIVLMLKKHSGYSMLRIVQAQAPSGPIERCITGPGGAGQWAELKALYCQSEIYAQPGVELRRSVL